MRVRKAPREEPLTVLFVCTANICRSPYAERRATQLTAGDDSLVFESAGIPGSPWQGMDPVMAAELSRRGGTAVDHVSRILTPDILDHADLVVTAEFAHRLRIIDRWPAHAIKIFGLRQLSDALTRVPLEVGGLAALDQALSVSEPDGMAWDLADPYGRGRLAAAACADEIDRCLDAILRGLLPRGGRP